MFNNMNVLNATLKESQSGKFCVFYNFFSKRRKRTTVSFALESVICRVQQQWLLTMLSHHLGRPQRSSRPRLWASPAAPPPGLTLSPKQVRLPDMLSGATAQGTLGFAAKRGLSKRSKKMAEQASDQLSRRWGRGIRGMRDGDTGGGQHLLKVGLGSSDVTRSGAHAGGPSRRAGAPVRTSLNRLS